MSDTHIAMDLAGSKTGFTFSGDVLKKRSASIWGQAAIGILALAVFTVGGFGAVVPRSVPAASGSAASSSSAIAVTFTEVIKSSGITFKQDSTQTEEKYYLDTMGTGVAWLDYARMA